MATMLWLMFIVQRAVWCAIPLTANTRHAKDGNYVIGGIFPFRSESSNGPCSSGVSRWGIELSETMIFAIDEINSNSEILPDCIIGYDIRDTCWSEEFTLYSTNSLAAGDTSLSGSETSRIPIGLIGPETSVHAVLAGKVASLYEIPIISYSATSNELSNKDRFPYFLRTVPPDKLQARAIVDLLLHYDWRYVGLLYSADTYGIHGALEVLNLAEQNDVCVAFSVPIREDPTTAEIDDIVTKMHVFRKATVIVIFSYSSRIYRVLNAFHDAYPQSMRICIGSDGFSGWSLRRYGLANVTIGSFFVRLSANTVPFFEEHFRKLQLKSTDKNVFSPWLTEYIDTRIALKNCSNLTSCPVEMISDESNVYTAVYAYAYALQNLHQSRDNGASCSNISGKMLLPYLLNVSFQSVGGYVKFDMEGNSGGKYILTSWQLSPNGQFERVTVGTWDSHMVANHLDISEDTVQWPMGSRQPPPSICRDACGPGLIPVPLEQKCCWGCQECPVNAIVVNVSFCKACPATFWPSANRSVCEAIVPTPLDWKGSASLAVVMVSVIGLIVSALTAVGLLYYRNHVLIKATSRELSCINISGLMIAFSSVFALLGRPSHVICTLSESMISLSFTLIYAPTLLKVNRIFRIFQASRKSVRRPRFVGPRHQVMLASVFIAIQVLLSVMSATLSPSAPTVLLPSDLRKFLELYCLFGNGFIVIAAYNVIIILACCFYAFKTRKVPSNYNESKFIAVSVYSTVVLFLAVIPVYATALEVLHKVATLCVAIQINAYLTLVLVYLPKLYGIRFVQDLNVQEWRTSTTGNKVDAVSGSRGNTLTISRFSVKSNPAQTSANTQQVNESAGPSSAGNSGIDEK